MAYSWTAHLKKVCSLLQKSGKGFDGRFTASDAKGNYIDYLSPDAVRFSLYGANIKAMHDLSVFPAGSTLEQRIAINQRRRDIMMSLFGKAGLPNAKRLSTIAMLDWEKVATWAQVEKLLREAYAIAKKAETKWQSMRVMRPNKFLSKFAIPLRDDAAKSFGLPHTRTDCLMKSRIWSIRLCKPKLRSLCTFLHRATKFWSTWIRSNHGSQQNAFDITDIVLGS